MGAPLTAVVVHHRQPERCAETVAALHQQGVPLRVVVVDNGGDLADGDVAGATVVPAGANLGFGGGANVGLRRWLAAPAAEAGEWALVVPHDARPAPDCLPRLLAAVAGRPRAGLACAEYGLDEVPIVDPYLGGITVPAERGEGWEPAGFAHGTFLLVRRGCLEDVGLFDERYFAYSEEADLSVRARRAGWEVGMVWGAVVDNPHQGSNRGAIDYLMVRNTALLARWQFGRWRGAVQLVLAVWSTVVPRRRSPWFSLPARVAAVRDAVLGKCGPPPPSLR